MEDAVIMTEDAIVVFGLSLFYFSVAAALAVIAVVAVVAETTSLAMAIAVALFGSYLSFVVVVEILAANKFLLNS